MKSVFGLNYFVFCITALILILYCTRDMRDEAFDIAAITSQLASTQGSVREYFGMAPGVGDQMVDDEGFDNTGALVQLAASRAPPTRKCNIFSGWRSIFSGWGEPFVGFDDFPQLEYSTSVNKVDRKIDKQIYDNLTTQGMSRMSPESKYVPYHCPKGLME
jgi:hypothetical protein